MGDPIRSYDVDTMIALHTIRLADATRRCYRRVRKFLSLA